jgi:hypothetical protein
MMRMADRSAAGGRAETGASADRGRLLLANSAVALILADSLSVFLHESAHAITGLVRGVTPTLHPNSVDYTPTPDPTTQLITAAAGPLFSLVFGLIVFAACRSAGRGFLRLFFMWLGLVSMQNFFGYLFIAPFAGAGDTGRVLSLLRAPVAVYIACGVIGAALTLLNARLLAGQVMRYATGPTELRRLVLFPWLIATAVAVALTPLNLIGGRADPATLPLIMAGAFAIAIFAPMFTLFYRRISRPYERLDLGQPMVPLIITAGLIVAINLLTAPGLRLR